MKEEKNMMEKHSSALTDKNANPEEAKMNDDSKESETSGSTEEKSIDGETESGSVESKSLVTNDGLSNTPYDDVFRTIINDAREMVLPLLNEIFGEHYIGTEKIEFA